MRKGTIRIKFDNRERARDIIKALGRSQYFQDDIPSIETLTKLLRLPKTSIGLALEDLEKANVIQPRKDLLGYIYRGDPTESITGQIGFIVNIDLFESWNSVFQDWLLGCDDIMSQEGYHIKVATSFASVEDKIEAIEKLWHQGVCGFVLASLTEPQVREYILDSEIPAVVLGNATVNQQEIGCVSTDNRIGIEKMISYLLSNNHQKIFFYGAGLSNNEGFLKRMRAYEQFMRLSGLDPHPELIFHEPHHPMIASEAVARLQKIQSHPTAIVCASDREAFELVAELKHSGYRIPQDISITGYANNHYGQVLKPAMTTMDIYGRKMGQVAANYLLNELQQPQLPVKILLPTDLVIRESTAPLPDHIEHDRSLIKGIDDSASYKTLRF